MTIDRIVTGTDIAWTDMAPHDKPRVRYSSPAMLTSGHDFRILSMAQDSEYVTRDDTPVIVTLLRGALASPFSCARSLRTGESGFYENSVIRATQPSLLLLAYCNTSFGPVKERLHSQQWVAYGRDRFRSDPLIAVDGISICLRYIAPLRSTGIHDHSDRQMREWYTQLRGSGWVKEYSEQDPNSEVVRHELQLGQSHPHLYRTEDGRVQYPWHAYESGRRGALLIAFEDRSPVAKTT